MNASTNRFKILIAAALLFLAAQRHSLAGSATWSTNPSSGDWNDAANWVPSTVPNAASDIATFGVSGITDVSNNVLITLDSIVFSSGAPSFTITTESVIFLKGGGVVNNSGIVQSFPSPYSGGVYFYNGGSAGNLVNYSATGAPFVFYDSSSAGSATFEVTYGPFGPGEVSFSDTTSAADSTINATLANIFFENNATAANAVITASDNGGPLFGDETTAGNALITLSSGASAGFTETGSADHGIFTANGAQSSSDTPASVLLGDESSATEGTFIINGGAATGAAGAAMDIGSKANAGSANITVNGGIDGGAGGALAFQGKANGGTASVSVFGNGKLDISARQGGVIIGSLAGNGSVLLGANTLTIGSNNQSTTFSGVIQGTGGLTKTGTGTLTLSGKNTHTGSTTVSAGTLLANTKRASSTGAGSVNVNAGTLGGKGMISGLVTIGTGAVLAPSAASNQPLTLSLTNGLVLNSSSTYNCQLNIRKATADQVIAKGVTIGSAAQLSLATVANKRLTVGTVFTVISNTSATPINGTFANLADGAIIAAGRNKLQASYVGGDGNDLTLTVVR